MQARKKLPRRALLIPSYIHPRAPLFAPLILPLAQDVMTELRGKEASLPADGCKKLSIVLEVPGAGEVSLHSHPLTPTRFIAPVAAAPGAADEAHRPAAILEDDDGAEAL